MNRKKVFSNLKRARLERGLSQVEVAKKAGLHRPYLSNFENGHSIPGPETAEKLAKILNVPACWLLEK